MSEPDKGQTDAINKGLRNAKGKWFAWINADDYYEPHAFSAIADMAIKHPKSGVIYGNCQSHYEDGRIMDNIPPTKVALEDFFSGNIIFGPSAFYNTKLINKKTGFDVSLDYWMDYDMFMHLIKRSRFIYTNTLLAHFSVRPGQKSNNPILLKKMASESYTVARKHGAPRFSYLWRKQLHLYLQSFFKSLPNLVSKLFRVTQIGKWHERLSFKKRLTYSLTELADLDQRYFGMNQSQFHIHSHLIHSIRKKGKSVLEVACGTGWNVSLFEREGFKYFGLDLSEIALATASLKYPQAHYINLSVHEMSLLQNESFDVVYNSAMLEHIDGWEHAIDEMVRVAKHAVYIVFFEGLSLEEKNSISFHPTPLPDLNKKAVFGPKLQNQAFFQTAKKGYYWNRFSLKYITTLMKKRRYKYKILNSSNTTYIKTETVLVISKIS